MSCFFLFVVYLGSFKVVIFKLTLCIIAIIVSLFNKTISIWYIHNFMFLLINLFLNIPFFSRTLMRLNYSFLINHLQIILLIFNIILIKALLLLLPHLIPQNLPLLMHALLLIQFSLNFLNTFLQLLYQLPIIYLLIIIS